MAGPQHFDRHQSDHAGDIRHMERGFGTPEWAARGQTVHVRVPRHDRDDAGDTMIMAAESGQYGLLNGVVEIELLAGQQIASGYN